MTEGSEHWGTAGLLSRVSAKVAGLNTRLYLHAFYLSSATAVNALGGFAFWLLAARLYQPQQVGLGSATLSTMTLLIMVSQLGLGMGLLRFLPTAKEHAPYLLQAAFVTAAVVSAILTFVFWVGIPLWAPTLTFLREQLALAALCLLFVVGAAVSPLQDYGLLALRRTKFTVIKSLIFNLARLALLFIFVAMAAGGIIVSVGIAMLVSVILGFWGISRIPMHYRFLQPARSQYLRMLLPFAIGNHLADFSLNLPALVLPLIVINVLGTEEGAYFYAAWFSGYLLLALPLHLANSLLTEGSYDEGKVVELAKKALTAALFLVIVGISVVFLLGDKLLLLFGQGYSEKGFSLLRLVALSAVPGSIVHVFLGVQKLGRRIKSVVVVSMLVAGTTLLVSYLLLPGLGLTGAGLGLLIGQGAGASIAILSLALSLKKKTGASSEERLEAQAHVGRSVS